MRTVLSLVVLAAFLWASCTVKLGAYTLAEHVDRIGETDEAKALLSGTRGKIEPVLEDMKHRILGEYVEAPTTRSTREQVRPTRPTRRADAKQANEKASARKSEAGTEDVESTRSATRPAKSEERGAKVPTALGASAGQSRGASTAEASRVPGSRRTQRE